MDDPLTGHQLNDRRSPWAAREDHLFGSLVSSFLPTPLDGAIERAQQQPRAEFYLAVTLPSDDLIGFVRLAFAGVQAAKLGYAIRADQWGHGYALDATRTIVNFGFSDLQLHRISAAIGPDNAASTKIAERLGMQLEGRIRDHVFTNGAWRDSLLYAVLVHEWGVCCTDG
ncbi:GNAT family N-acetyltransferase [Salinispora cortesiana]|uniref:GNAT family N-acetyltransferase n=1 Tax=Salinispora cortesiana TaxID=1305843 RepID=UPI00046ED25C|nr:GNAT family protein [Salinispora cortesiana]